MSENKVDMEALSELFEMAYDRPLQGKYLERTKNLSSREAVSFAGYLYQIIQYKLRQEIMLAEHVSSMCTDYGIKMSEAVRREMDALGITEVEEFVKAWNCTKKASARYKQALNGDFDEWQSSQRRDSSD